MAVPIASATGPAGRKRRASAPLDAGGLVEQRHRHGEHPLADRHVRQDVIDQVRGVAPCAGRPGRAKFAPLQAADTLNSAGCRCGSEVLACTGPTSKGTQY